eukprot:s7784_g1.t3
MDQRIADAPYPWRERFQGFASLLYQSDDRDDDWLLNESGWDGPSTMYRVPGQAVLTFLESLHYVCVSLRVILGFSVSSSRRTSPSTTREAGNRRGDPSSSRSCGARGTPASYLLEVVLRGISAWLWPAGRQALDLRPLASFGAEVRGLDLSSPDLPSGQLRTMLWEHGLLLFRDQDLLEEDVLRVASAFAEPVPAAGQQRALATY